MSIATSAIIKPSRTLYLLKLLMACVLFVTAARLITMAAPKTPDIVHTVACLLCVFAGCLLALSCRTLAITLRIDITATGQIRLTHTSHDAFKHGSVQQTQAVIEGEAVQLMKDSTLWSSMLILRLRNGSGKVIVLPILRDSMTKNAFRSVCVACHWIAAQNTRPASAFSYSESQFD